MILSSTLFLICKHIIICSLIWTLLKKLLISILESITDDVVITVNSNGEYLSSLTFQLDGVNFEYVFSDFNAVTDLTLPEVTVIEQKEDETAIILPEED